MAKHPFSLRQEISSVLIKHKFTNVDALSENIMGIANRIASDNQALKSIPRNSEKHRELKELESSIKMLLVILKNTSDENRIRLSNELSKKLSITTPRFETDLENVLIICRNLKEDTPKDKGGRRSDSCIKQYLFYLSSIYIDGTGLMPTCGWNDIKEKFAGSFFDFVWDVWPYLVQEHNKLSATYKTLGKLTRDVLTEESELLKIHLLKKRSTANF